MSLVNDRSDAGRANRASVVPVALVGLVGLALVLFLSWRNLGLRGDLARELSSFQTLEETIAWNLQLSALEGTRLPDSLTTSLRPEIASEGDRPAGQTLLIVYTPTVCVSCLRAGLLSLQANRSDLESEGIFAHALIGERRRTRESALLLREDGLLTFPMTFVPADTVLDSLPFGRQAGFTDTPLYLLLDRDLNVRSVFKADQRRSALLDQWLAAHSAPTQRPRHAP